MTSSELAKRDDSHKQVGPVRPQTKVFDMVPRQVTPTRTRHIILAGALIGALFFGGFGAWAAFAPLKSAVVGSGSVKVSGNRKVIEHLEGGIVTNILVDNGDFVEAGQPLIRLDENQWRANLGLLTGRLFSAMARDARLVAEQNEEDEISFPDELITRQDDPEIAEIIRTNQAVFDSRKRAMESALQVRNEQIDQLTAEIEGGEKEKEALMTQLVYINAEIEDVQGLYEKGLARKPRVNALRRQQASLQGNIGRLSGQVARSRQRISEIEEQKNQLTRQMMSQVAEALQETRDQIYDTRQRILGVQDTLNRLEVRAPIAGRVVARRINTVGAVLSPGDAILDIVPEGDPLIIEVQIAPSNIDEVFPGQDARVRISAYSYRSTPSVWGKVIHVSADTLVEPGTGAPYYRAEVELDPMDLESKPGIELYPGMPAEIFIETGERTFADYILSPLMAGFERSLREL